MPAKNIYPYLPLDGILPLVLTNFKVLRLWTNWTKKFSKLLRWFQQKKMKKIKTKLTTAAGNEFYQYIQNVFAQLNNKTLYNSKNIVYQTWQSSPWRRITYMHMKHANNSKWSISWVLDTMRLIWLFSFKSCKYHIN